MTARPRVSAAGLAVLAALALLLAAGRPAYSRVVVTATPSPTATHEPTAALTPSTTSTATPTFTPTPMPLPSPTATATPTASPTPAPVVHAGPTGGWPLIVVGKPRTGLVALTFDAGGRDPGLTSQLLDALQHYGAHCTFFLTGEWAEANPELVRRMVSDGHELANHTYDHPHLPQVADQGILDQLSRTEQAVQKVAGVALQKYVRPPFGDYDDRVLALLTSHGYSVVYWSLDSADWRPEFTSRMVQDRVGEKAGAGDIVVAHCYAPKTAEAYPGVLASLRARGLRFGTLSQVLGR